MIRINLRGATRSWYGAYARQGRSGPLTGLMGRLHQENMDRPSAILSAWIGTRLDIWPERAEVDGNGLKLRIRGSLSLAEIQRLTRVEFLTSDGCVLVLRSIDSETYGISDYDDESTHAQLVVWFSPESG